MKYFVYFNLHKKTWSLKNNKTKLVDFHSDVTIMRNCDFKVSQAGRKRVLEQKRKNVHAGVLGEVVQSFDIFDTMPILPPTPDYIEITYNPYKYDSFVIKATGEKVNSADKVIMQNKKVYAKGLK